MRATKAELQKEVDRLTVNANRQRLIHIKVGSQEFTFDFDGKLEVTTPMGYIEAWGNMGSYR